MDDYYLSGPVFSASDGVGALRADSVSPWMKSG